MVVVGMVFSAALMASVVIYSDAIRDLGLKHALESADPVQLDIHVQSSSQSLRPAEHQQRTETTTRAIENTSGDIVSDQVRFIRTATFFLTPPGAEVPAEDNRPRANFMFADDFAEHVKLVDGVAPKPASQSLTARVGPSLETWVSKETADAHGVKVGDRYDLHPFWRLEADPIHLTVTGIFEPNDPAERYWSGRNWMFEPTTGWPTYLFWSDEPFLTQTLSVYLPDLDGTIDTFAFVDVGNINSRNAKSVEDRQDSLESGLPRDVPRTTVTSSLSDTIKLYRDKLFFTRLPLFALMIQVVGIVLYYLVMVSTMVVDRQTGEIALLKSRGASVPQLMGIYFIESLLLSAIAVAIGPFLIAFAISLLGYTPPFEDLSGNGRLEIHLSSQAFMLAGLGAFLGMLAMLWPAYRASQLSVVHYKTHMARPQKQSVFLRYYLDLVLIVVGAFLFYQLRQRGSLVTDRLFGDLSADPLLLATPTLFMLMMALLFLRLFPLGLRVVSWAAKGLNGATVPLGLWHVVRSPLQYTRLILLLILATAVGMFAAGFGATLERSYDDRAAYEGGADGRLVAVRSPGGVDNATFSTQVKDATGAELASAAARMDASYNPTRFNTIDLQLLGVEPDVLPEVAFWRDDFASTSLEELLAPLVVEENRLLPVGTPIPEGTRFLGLWVKAPLNNNQYTVSIRLRDAKGITWDYRMDAAQQPAANEWRFFRANLQQGQVRPGLPPAVPSAHPISFEAIAIRPAQGPATAQRVPILVDELQAFAGTQLPSDAATNGFGSAGMVVEGFESLDQYEVISGAALTVDPGAISRNPNDKKGGESSAVVAFNWARLTTPVTGLRVRTNNGPLPVIVDQGFIDRSGNKIGDELNLYVSVQYVTVKIAGVFEYFPGFDPAGKEHLMVADLRSLQVSATKVPSTVGLPTANEAWLRGVPEGSLTLDALGEKGIAADQAFERAALRAEAASDPLVAASWSGILFLSFVAVLVITAIGFIVSTHLAAQTRSLEFAILRTMGFNNRQILSLVSLEQCFVVVAGLAVGTLLGLPLIRLMIGYLGINETGADVLPPMISKVNWTTVLIADGILMLVFIGTILSLAWTYSRLAVSRTLRMGEL